MSMELDEEAPASAQIEMNEQIGSVATEIMVNHDEDPGPPPVQMDEKRDDPLDKQSQSLKSHLAPGNRLSSKVPSSNTARSANSVGTGSYLRRNQRAWIDPYEPRIKDTWYAKNTKSLDTLRPKFAENVTRVNMRDLKTLFDDDDVDGDDKIEEENEDEEEDDEELLAEEQAAKAEMEKEQAPKLGTWEGVFANCLLNIFGVIMFLRVGWVVGQAGVIQAILIMAISALVTSLTTLSMSAIATNGEIKGGGAYYLISRSLGPAVGGSVGILFSFGNMVAVSLYLIGFSETFVSQLGNGKSIIFGDPVSDVRLVANVMLILVLLIALGGLKYVVKVQLFLLAFIVLSILLLFVGSFYQTAKVKLEDEWDNCFATLDDENCFNINGNGGDDCVGEKVQSLWGVNGWGNGNLNTNMNSDYSKTDGVQYSFFTTLSIFFPAVTGIMAGANISGDLADPSVSIPKGTLTAIGLSTIVYWMLALFAGAVASRCSLLNNYLIMADICVWPYFVLIGIYAATASSGIASLVGAPRILQAVANDKLFPKWINYFAKTDNDGNPLRGYYLTFGIAFACNLIGELNLVAPLITTFFMITYTIINFSCFYMEISHTPGWRPSFKYFNRYTAIIGALLCCIIMFLMDWIYSMCGVILACALYVYVIWKDPKVNWGAGLESRKYYSAYKALLALQQQKKHVKNWRPGFLILTKNPLKRPHLVVFGQTLRKSYGPIIYARIMTGDYRTDMRQFHSKINNEGYLPANEIPKKIKGFYESVLADNFRNGSQMLLQTAGLGGIRPNTLVIGFSHEWKKYHSADFAYKSEKSKRAHKDRVHEYVQILRDALRMGFGVMVCCNFGRVNWLIEGYVAPASSMDDPGDHDFEDFEAMTRAKSERDVGKDGAKRVHSESNDLDVYDPDKDPDGHGSANYTGDPSGMNTGEMGSQQKIWGEGQGKHTTIDVWWLLDDGGLLILLPHIMKLHAFWSQCHLRVNVIVDPDDINTEVIEIDRMIKQFRLSYTSVRQIELKRKDPSPKTILYFEKLAKMKLSKVSRPKTTKRWLRVSELMRQHSRFSGMNVVTLPRPDRGEDCFSYMAILEMLCRPGRMPPTIIMRGNGENALTWYAE